MERVGRASTVRRRVPLAALLALAAGAAVLFQGLAFLSSPASSLDGALLAAREPRSGRAQRAVSLAARGGAEAADDDDDDEYEFDDDYGVNSMATLRVGKELEGVVVRVLDRVVIVDVGVEKEGIIPIGKLVERGQISHPSDVVKEGDSVKVWVVEVDNADDPRNSKLVLSMAANKVIDQRKLGEPADLALFKDVDSEEWLDGLVLNSQDFGAFVSVKLPSGEGQAQGLVYRTELKDDGVKIAERVKVRVLSVDPAKKRMALSMKEPRPAAGGEDLEAFKSVDESVFLPGVVKRIEEFGAFVEVEPPGGGQPVSGLVHVSQIKDGFIEDPAEELEIEQKVEVRVIEVGEKGLSLSMKQRQAEAA